MQGPPRDPTTTPTEEWSTEWRTTSCGGHSSITSAAGCRQPALPQRPTQLLPPPPAVSRPQVAQALQLAALQLQPTAWPPFGLTTGQLTVTVGSTCVGRISSTRCSRPAISGRGRFRAGCTCAGSHRICARFRVWRRWLQCVVRTRRPRPWLRSTHPPCRAACSSRRVSDSERQDLPSGPRSCSRLRFRAVEPVRR